MDRIKILEDAILSLIQDDGYGERCICGELARIAFDDVWLYRKSFSVFPEFKKYKPTPIYSLYGWFPYTESGIADRLAIMLLVLDEICRAEKSN